MDKYFVKGGQKLFGAVEIPPAKNACLPILAAAILCQGTVKIENCPNFLDIKNMIGILRGFGAKVTKSQGVVTMDMSALAGHEISASDATNIRSSVFCLGALLGRQKKAKTFYPGGCDIGSRPIDLHIKGLRALGAKILERHGQIFCDGSEMTAGVVHLNFPSVGATENVMMAAVTLTGTTKILNAALEPEIVDLANFLNKAGARVRGAGTSEIVIEGVETLGSVTYRPMPDRIIAGTAILATAMCGGEVIVKNCPNKTLDALFDILDSGQTKVIREKDFVVFRASGQYKAVSKICTMPYPGFPTDLQPQLVAYLSKAKGTSVVVENLFENRFKYVGELRKMGADITLSGQSAIIRGQENLYGANVFSPDLRAGAGLVLAALNANGYTTIENVRQIDRGYPDLGKFFGALGASVKRI